MAKTTRYGNRGGDPEERRPAPRGKSSGSPVLPLAILLGMIVGAVILARAIAGNDNQETEAAPPADTEPQPFADYHEAPPEERTRDVGGRSYPRAPDGLADSNPDWARAVAMATQADALFEDAQKAKMNDDSTTFGEKGVAAKEKYDEAFTLTAVWEEELLEKYGDRDPQVKAIMRVRNKWVDRMRVLHKTTGR